MAPGEFSRVDLECDQITGSGVCKHSSTDSDDSAKHPAAGSIGPQFPTRFAIERVNSRLDASTLVDVRARDNAVAEDKDVAVEKVFARFSADFRFPLHVASFGVESTKQAVA
jgi:hypothetical protein